MIILQDRIDTALQSGNKVIKPNGVGFISLKAGAGERTDTETDRWFSYYSKEEFKEILERNQFCVIDQETRKGEKDWWLVYYVRK